MGLVKSPARREKNTIIYPWSEVKTFPSYPDGKGNQVPLPEQWREVGLKVPLPTLANAEHLDSQGTVVRQWATEDGKSKFTSPDYRLSRVEAYWTTGGFVSGWEGIVDENGEPLKYDGDWLHEQFNSYPFLFVTAYNYWKNLVKKADEEDKKEQENFTQESADSSIPT